ncbi:protein Dok-7 isoform X1 [Megalobrama amblycephala]|uniref:protein Dok-7 isoform X1 n=1 Tax=Megalobrama amblycephala TaxID=75352 RepID=UPI002013C5CD|nr:protein Dok-7 isoform X1 [Megalobrama amblycephala]
MSDTVIAEGAAKIRDGKKWRSRWLVLRKPSPVADCLVLYVYKERGVKDRSSVTLEHICGLEACVSADGVPFILSILCLSQTAMLGFDSKEALQSWDLRLRYCLGEVHSFSVSVLPGTKLESGAATLHLCNNVLVIAKDLPAVIIGHWNLLDLRRYGPVNNGFVFEGGTRCGYWAGVFLLSCAEGEQISFLFDCIVRGISPSRGPFGLKPLLPEPSVNAALVQDRLNHEAEELERRLSLLSHSTASSSRFGSSMTADDRSISGSSDTSDTDCSISSRSAMWTDLVLPSSAETPHPQASQVEEKLSTELKAPTDPVLSRKLKETGRQNSSDSGIATGSHSSYTGSFSSYSGSLDAAGPGEEYGMPFNLPPPAIPEKHLCACNHEYQIPSSLRYLYDSPRSLLEITSAPEDNRDSSRSQNNTGLIEPFVRKQSEEYSESPSQSDSGSALIHSLELGKMEESKTRKSLIKGEESQGLFCNKSCSDCANCSLPTVGSKSVVTTCHICRGLKGTFLPHPGGTLLPTVPSVTSAGESSSPPTGPATNQKPLSGHSQTNEEEQSEGYISCLSDLLAHYNPAGKSVSSSVYEAMSSSRRPVHSIHNILYENCLQCRKGEGNCRVLRLTPPSRLAIFVQDQSRDPSRNNLNIPESICSSIEHPSRPVSLQQKPEEDNIERIWADKGRSDPAYEIMDGRTTERSPELEERSRFELIGNCAASQRISHHLTEGGVLAFAVDGSAVTDRLRGDAVTYVNIPTSPTSKKQLHYMELELQESSTTIRGKSSSKYAQIDIAATEAAHRAVTQHALGREEGLQRLEQQRRRRGLKED